MSDQHNDSLPDTAPRKPEAPATEKDPSPTDIIAAAEQGLPLAALTDWITFLQGPSEPLFKRNCRFDTEWKRLFRLLSLVLLMLGAIMVIFSLGLTASGQSWRDFASNSKYLLLVLVVGAVVAVPYAFILAPLLRIRITFAQTFFTVLLLGLPWLPLITLVWAFGTAWSSGLLVAIFLYIMTLVPLYNFCKGVSVIAGCRTWRPILSLVIPLGLALAVFVANVVWE
jgi:hypothetical protein